MPTPFLALILALVSAPGSGQAAATIGGAAQDPDRAWQQGEPYRAPDFEAYFPDDPEGAARLDRLIDAGTLRGLDDADYLACIRQGLRRMKNHRTLVLAGLGNRFIWNVERQHPDAIELCYHAADFSAAAEVYGTRHYAVYFGLSVVRGKSPAILRTLTDLCVAVDDPNDLSRVAWGAADQMDELLPYLQPHLRSEDPYVREKAAAVAQILRGERQAFEWAAERRKLPSRPRPWVEMPDLRASLSSGDSAARLAALDRIQRERLGRDMNDSYLADLARAARDESAAVREAVARTVGGIWIAHGRLHRTSDEAVGLVLALSRDPDPEVRYDAVYYGLSNYSGENLAVLERLVEMALDRGESASHDRILWALERWKAPLIELLESVIAGPDAARARAAHTLYWQVFDEAPAVVPSDLPTADDLVGEWSVRVVGPPGGGGMAILVRVVQEAKGVLALAAGDENESARVRLQDWLSTEVDGVLYLDGHLDVEGVDVHLTARLADDTLSGTLRPDGGAQLTVWSGVRR